MSRSALQRCLWEPQSPNLSVAGRYTRARCALLERFADRICPSPHLNRALVSYQANRSTALLRWFHYKEGFSQKLVACVIEELGLSPGVLLDPFAGVGTALLAGRNLGWHTIGIELLPLGPFVLRTWLAAEKISPDLFRRNLRRWSRLDWACFARADSRFPHLAITQGAFPPRTEEELAGFRAWWCKRSSRANDDCQLLMQLLNFAAMSVLEEVSYTRKDGQYLRWDWRSGRSRGAKPFDKGPLPSFVQALSRKLHQMANDLEAASFAGWCTSRSTGNNCIIASEPKILTGSCLQILPELPSQSVHLVFTSPPYCNRYDYTRTYALELAWLGCGESEIKQLRQAMLSCTVENREKDRDLQALYQNLGRLDDYYRIRSVWQNLGALTEILELLEADRQAHRLNNPNLPRMIRNYFYETAFWVAECARLLRPGGYCVVVNDNVRYSGEEVPVDLICSALAESFGLQVQAIWVLPRGKGNSSQQMGRHGRIELRKGVYIWSKPQ
jgi:DNA modification methylase